MPLTSMTLTCDWHPFTFRIYVEVTSSMTISFPGFPLFSLTYRSVAIFFISTLTSSSTLLAAAASYPPVRFLFSLITT